MPAADHALLSVRDEFRLRLFLDRVARQQSPSPLHRRSQINMQSAEAQAKGDVSTLLERGHFYFALTRPRCSLDAVGARELKLMNLYYRAAAAPFTYACSVEFELLILNGVSTA
jgi:hypothetical protein